MRKVIFDVDTGSDDAVELIYALKNENLDILGITTVFGSAPVEDTTKHTLQLLDMLNCDIPLYKGSCKSLVSEIYDNNNPVGVRTNKLTDSSGKTIGFHEVFTDKPTVRKEEKIHAVTFLTDVIMKSKEKVTLVTSGALTNIAISFRVKPEIKEHIEEIIIMGGGVNISNKTAYAEGNFFRDPEAAKIVLQSGVKVVLIPLDATYDYPYTSIELDYFKSLNSLQGDFISKVIEGRIEAYNALSPLKQPDIAILHDVLCALYLQDNAVICEFADYPVTVSTTHNEGCGMLLCDRREGYHSDSVKIAMAVNRELYQQMLFSL